MSANKGKGSQDNGKLLSRDEILERDDRVTQDICVPEWNGTVRIKTLEGGERDAFDQTVHSSRDANEEVRIDGLKVALIAASCVDEKGALLFSPQDVEKLNKKNSRAINRIFVASRKLSAIGDDELEALEKNSSAAQSG